MRSVTSRSILMNFCQIFLTITNVSVANSVEMTTVYVDVPENTNLLIQQLLSLPLVAGKPIQITIGAARYFDREISIHVFYAALLLTLSITSTDQPTHQII